MKRTKLLLIGILAAIPLFGGAVVAHAQSFRSGGNVTVASGQTVDKTLFAAGRSINIAGRVNGDVFCAGQNVTVSGTVTGDVICAGQNVHVTGKVLGDVRVAGQDVAVDARVGSNLTAAGQSVLLERGTTVRGDASVAGQDATVRGEIGRDLAASVNNLLLASKVGRDMTFTGKDLHLSSQANVGGGIEYTSEHTLAKDRGAHIAGNVTHHTPKTHPQRHFGSLVGLRIGMAMYMFVALLLVALVLVLLFPQLFHRATETALHKPGTTLLVGIGASLLVPMMLVATAVTVVGIPLAVLGLLAWLVVLFLSGPFAAYFVGRLLLQRSGDTVLIMVLGAVVLLLLYFVPWLGALVWLLAMWFGTGIILMHIPRLPKPRYALAGSTDKPAKKKNS